MSKTIPSTKDTPAKAPAQATATPGKKAPAQVSAVAAKAQRIIEQARERVLARQTERKRQGK